MPKFDSYPALVYALQRAGFRRDHRAREAYSLPGQEGMIRVDFGGPRSKSARFEVKDRGDYRGVGPTLYFGYMKTQDDVDGWARYFHALATDAPGVSASTGHPSIPEKKPAKPRASRSATPAYVPPPRVWSAQVEPSTAGFYVTHRYDEEERRLDEGPFATLDEALPIAWEVLQRHQSHEWARPIQIVEANDDVEALSGGHVWWQDGKRRGAPVPEEQTRFANMARNGTGDLRMLSPDEVARLPIGSIVGTWRRDEYSPEGTVDQDWVVVPGGLAPTSLLPKRSGGWTPDGEPADTLGREFVLIAEGRGEVPTHGTAVRKGEAWLRERKRNRALPTAQTFVVRFPTDLWAQAFLDFVNARVEAIRRSEGPLARIKPGTSSTVLLRPPADTNPDDVRTVAGRYHGVVSDEPVRWTTRPRSGTIRTTRSA